MNSECAFGADCESNPHTAWISTGGKLCRECAANTCRDIGLLVYDYVDLSQRIPKNNRLPETRIARPKPGSTVPLDLRIITVRETIVDQLIHWEARVRLHLREPEPSRQARDGFLVQRAALTVGAHVRLIAGLPDGLDGLRALRITHRRAVKIVARTVRTVPLPAECPDRTCRQRRLSTREGTQVVTCAGCGGRWSLDDYERYVTLRVREIPTLDAAGS